MAISSAWEIAFVSRTIDTDAAFASFSIASDSGVALKCTVSGFSSAWRTAFSAAEISGPT